jgi:hypothetical protein
MKILYYNIHHVEKEQIVAVIDVGADCTARVLSISQCHRVFTPERSTYEKIHFSPPGVPTTRLLSFHWLGNRTLNKEQDTMCPVPFLLLMD